MKLIYQGILRLRDFAKKHKTMLLLTVIVLLGFYLRLYNIEQREIWYDEAFSAKMITNSYRDIFTLSQKDYHPPLYYWILKSWVTLFGNGELSLRLPSIICGVALIPLSFYLVTYLLNDTRKAMWVSLAIAVNPFLITYSHEARSYALVALLTVLATFFTIKAIRYKVYWPLALLLPLLFLTHYVTIFGIVVFVAIVLFFDRKFVFYTLPLTVVVSYWLPIVLNNPNTDGINWILPFTWIRIPQTIHAFLFGVNTNSIGIAQPTNPFHIEGIIVSCLVCIGVLFILAAARRPSRDEIILIISAVLPIVLVALSSMYAHKNAYVERYLIGYGALACIAFVLLLKKPMVFMIPYVLISIYLTMTFKPINAGYRALHNYDPGRPIVMVDASEYINAKYYNNMVWLQDGDWAEWSIITSQDIWHKETAKEDFYLVNRKGLPGWDPTLRYGVFKLYKWDIE